VKDRCFHLIFVLVRRLFSCSFPQGDNTPKAEQLDNSKHEGDLVLQLSDIMSHVCGADRRNHDLNIDEYLEPTSTMQLHTAGREGAGGELSGMAMHLSGQLAAPYMRALSKKDETRRNKLEARQKNGDPIPNAQQPSQTITESVSFQCNKSILPPVSADNMAPLVCYPGAFA
jgi:hypothetical protein